MPLPLRRAVRWLVPAFVLALLSPNSADGQDTPLCPSGCLGGVFVTPDGGTATKPANGGPFSLVFNVRNVSAGKKTFTLTCGTTGGLTCGSVTPPSVTLFPDGDNRDVTVTYTTGATGGEVWLTAAATGASDDGYYTVTVNSYGAPPVTLRNHNGDNRDRSLCLVSGAGEAAGVQCGDLLITHSLPGYATLGRDRSLTLLYSSHQAAPRPLVALTVTQGGTLPTPTSVFAKLLVGPTGSQVGKDSATWNAWGGGVPTARQMVLGNGYDASTDSSGLYPFTILVRNVYSGIGSYDTTVSDTLIVVNRRMSRFGAGWSIAGIEELRLNQPGNKILWIGGDGSAKAYRNVNATTWAAAAGAYRDTLVRFDSASSSWYRRTLRHGVQVTYDIDGRHVRTTNRARQYTRFHWRVNGSGWVSILDSIAVPPHNTDGTNMAGTVYRFAYTASDTTLHRITDPAGRVLDVSVVSRRLSQIVDPDTTVYHTDFTYETDARMATRTNRRGYTTSYRYGNGPRVDTVKVPLDVSTGDTAKTVVSAWDEKGLAIGQTGQIAVDTSTVYTQIDGPRTDVADVAKFWVDRWGAPVTIVDPIAARTDLERADATAPALVTKVAYPDNRIVKMSWNARGNLSQIRDSTSHLGAAGLPLAVTQWFYTSPNTLDAPDSVIDPVGIRTRYAYDTLGLPQRVTAANGHFTDFDVIPNGTLKGIVRGVVERSVPTWDSVSSSELLRDLRSGFAFNSLGNVVSDTSPLGRVRRTPRDFAQRVDTVVDPGGHRTDLVYDAVNRMLQSIQHVSDSGLPATLVTAYRWGVDALDSIVDPRGVNRGFGYDAALRPKQERDDYQMVETRFFNRAGLVDSMQPRINKDTLPLQVRHAYDAAGRLLKTRWNPRDYSTADSVRFTYDTMGRMLTALTSARLVARTWFATGALKREVQSAASGGGPTTHTYGYDAAGRRIWYVMGVPGNTSLSDSVTYLYDATSGDLRWIKVRWRGGTRDSVQLYGDALGRRDTVIYSNGARVKFAYDKDGALRLVCGMHTGGPFGDVFKFTRHNVWIDIDGLIRETREQAIAGCGASPSPKTTSNSYDTRHQLARQITLSDTNTYRYDASGNRTLWRWASGSVIIRNDSNYTDPNHNRLVRTRVIGDPPSLYRGFSYDSTGSRLVEQWFQNGQPTGGPGWRAYFYDGLGRPTGTEEFQCTQWDVNGNCSWWSAVPSPTSCSYDPVGRMHDPCENLAPFLGFDGENVVRTGNDSTVNSATWTLVHGPGTDDPLMAHYTTVSPGYTAYIMTDGAGRHLAVGDPDGYDCSGGLQTNCGLNYANNGGKYSGAISNAQSFGADRHTSVSVYKIGFFRNRFYDQQTGRWTQEDPIGIAGGFNQYQYVNNNPANFIDPFGLTACKYTDNWDHWDFSQKRLPDGKSVTLKKWHDCPNERTVERAQQGRAATYTAVARCPALSRAFLARLNQELATATQEGRERGGYYVFDANRNLRMRMTGTNRQYGSIQVPPQPGASGYWHVHQPPGTQGPSVADSIIADQGNSTEVIRSVDSVFVIDPNGSIVGCAP
jgi:RHS repeat-associated protein